MSEMRSRPSVPRGRGSSRGGRGSYSGRGGRGGRANGHKDEISTETPSYEDEGEIGELKKMYASKLDTVKEMFPAWTDEDIVFALQETDGDLDAAVDRISEGTRLLSSKLLGPSANPLSAIYRECLSMG